MYYKISSDWHLSVSDLVSRSLSFTRLRALTIMPCGKLKRSPGYEMSWHWRRVHIVVVCRSIVIFSFFLSFFLRCNSVFNRNCSSLSHTFLNHQRLVQSKVNLLEYKNRLCRHETGDRLFQLAFFLFFFGSLGQLRAKVFTPPSLSCLVCSFFFNMEASTLHVT